MTQEELTTRILKFLDNTGAMPPNNGLLLHLEDFRELVMDMAKSRKMEAKKWLSTSGAAKRLYFKIGREKIRVKPTLAGLPLGAVAIELQ